MEEFYRRKLPHMQPKGANLFVTFRLAGSLPQAVIERLTTDRHAEMRIATTNEDRYLAERRHFGRFDEQLHQSSGPRCLLSSQLWPRLWPTASTTATARLPARCVFNSVEPCPCHICTFAKGCESGWLTAISQTLENYAIAEAAHGTRMQQAAWSSGHILAGGKL